MTETPVAPPRSRAPLLDLVRDEALEQEYREAAEARGATITPVSRRTTRTTAAAVVAVFGLLVTLAAMETSRNADANEASRAQVLERIENTDRSLSAAQKSLADLRAANAASEDALVELGGTLGETRARATRLGLRTGFAAATGPGIRITFANLPSADPSTEVVRDSDLAALVNGLWAAGAEAIAINGQRITAAGGIRNVGNHVEINESVLASPYTVLAIGNPDVLAARLLDTEGGADFFGLARQFGWNADTRNVSDVRVPAAPAGLQRLRSAQHLDDAGRGEAP